MTFLSRDNFPEKRELGPEQPFSGSNLERDRDTSGYFRYTHLAIYFQTDHKDLADAAPEKMDAIENECVEITNAIVNRIIDVYRFVTRESHVQRLGALHIPNLYFPQQNVGVYGLSLGHGIRSAVMNRPRQELITIGDMLDSQADIPVPELLFLDAEAALHTKRFILTVVHSFQALELFLEAFLESKFLAKGLDDAAVSDHLGRFWRTKERLRELLSEATGHTLSENSDLWDRFCTIYDQIRNKLIHVGKNIDEQKAKDTLETCRDVMNWVSAL